MGKKKKRLKKAKRTRAIMERIHGKEEIETWERSLLRSKPPEKVTGGIGNLMTRRLPRICRDEFRVCEPGTFAAEFTKTINAMLEDGRRAGNGKVQRIVLDELYPQGAEAEIKRYQIVLDYEPLLSEMLK